MMTSWSPRTAEDKEADRTKKQVNTLLEITPFIVKSRPQDFIAQKFGKNR
jgi:hypothetical protein